ncbi:hypothetical protein ACFVZR_39125 [Streptomyces sp. NPDC058316]|uniref:hypothetical protein n=1 Tax=Streptomyces sp. NPDC058316 TaxID=3346442 RepID=UPI0036E5B1F9
MPRSQEHRKAEWPPPVLSNIYLHKLDEFVDRVLVPEYTRGKRRARNPAYLELQNLLVSYSPKKLGFF